MRILSRIERLENELMPVAGGILRRNIVAIGENGEVVSTKVIEVPLPPPARKRGATA